MLYQILRVAACAILLCSTTVNAVGARALWNFVEAKKALQTKLGELRKMDSTTDVDSSDKLVKEIQGYIDDVKKLDPTKAAEFQEILDASFEQQVGNLEIAASQAKEKVEARFEKEAEKVAQQVEKIVKTVAKTENTEVKAAARNGGLGYLAYAKTRVSWAAYPFTSLINKSYKISMRLLDFVTMGKIEGIHKTYVGILKQEKEALATTIVNTSLVAAVTINGFLNNVVSNTNKTDATAALPPAAKRWFLGRIYDKAKKVVLPRTKDTFSGSELHSIVIGQLLEYGALLSPIVDLGKHSELVNQLTYMGEHIDTAVNILVHIAGVREFTQDELNLACSLYELRETLKSANEDSKKILNADNQTLYPDGKLNLYFGFNQENAKTIDGAFEVIFTIGKIDTKNVLDSRSYLQKMQDATSAKTPKIAAYKEEIAAIAGLALTIAGGSYLVQNYFPQKFKNKYSKYVVASMDSVIGAIRGVMGEAGAATKKAAEATLAAIKAKIPQLPFSEKIQKAFSSSYTRAVVIIGSAAGFATRLISKVTGSGQEIAAAQVQEERALREELLGDFKDNVDALKASHEVYEEGGLSAAVLKQEQVEVQHLSEVTGQVQVEGEGVGELFTGMELTEPYELFVDENDYR